jgi:hypothetical protein
LVTDDQFGSGSNEAEIIRYWKIASNDSSSMTIPRPIPACSMRSLAWAGKALALKKAQDDADAEPMFNIPDDADAATPFSHLSNLLARLKNPAASRPNSSVAPVAEQMVGMR